GPRLGPHALHDCAQIFVPALAIDHEGNRLGRGGGFYDRALATADAPKAALLFDTEILSAVPHEPHDISVDAAVCPGGVVRILRSSGKGNPAVAFRRLSRQESREPPRER